MSLYKRKVFNIAIIGAGQLGSRHLQGIGKSLKNLKIHVVDPSSDALALAEKRLKEFSEKKAFFYTSINDLPFYIELGIIATTSNKRREIIEDFLNKFSVKYLILEKIVFQKATDFKYMKSLFIQKKVKVWINCVRRSYLFYKNLIEELCDDRVLISVKGNNWGLACNGIHMIDLLQFLTKGSKIKIKTNNLKNIILDSKRSGFKELKGQLSVENDRGDRLQLNDEEKYEGNFIISIKNGNIKWDIFELSNFVIKHKINKDSYKEKIKIPYQSELSDKIVNQIINTGESDLTSYEECMQYHIPMLDAYNKHFSKIIGKDIVICPIT